MAINEQKNSEHYPIKQEIWNGVSSFGDLHAGENYNFEYLKDPKSDFVIWSLSINDLEELEARDFEDVVRSVLIALKDFSFDQQVKILSSMSSLRAVLGEAQDRLRFIVSQLVGDSDADRDYYCSQFAGTFFFVTEAFKAFAEDLVYVDVIEIEDEVWEDYEWTRQYVSEHPPDDEWLDDWREQVKTPPNQVEVRKHFAELRTISFGLLVDILRKSEISTFSLFLYWISNKREAFSVFHPIRGDGL
jgi:hypothetical protein